MGYFFLIVSIIIGISFISTIISKIRDIREKKEKHLSDVFSADFLYRITIDLIVISFCISKIIEYFEK
jgi:hypothetical protein